MADRKISDLTALTTPASGDYLPIVDISEASAANKNKRITIEELLRGAPDGTAGAPGFAFESDPDSGLYSTGANGVALSTGGTGRLFVDASGNVGIGTTSPGSIFDVKPSASSSTLRIETGTINSDSVRLSAGGTVNTYLEYRGYLGHAWFVDATERARIDSSGRLLVGTSSVSGSAGSSPYAKLQVQGNTFSSSGPGSISIRSGTAAASIGSGGEIGQISFAGSDNLEFARIDCLADAATGTNDYPGRLVFATTADGASSPTERMRITSDAYVRLVSGTGGIQFNGDTAAANALDDYEEGTWTPSVTFATPGDLSVTYTTQSGDYIKIGRLVTVRFIISTSSFTHTTAANAIRITGLPFARQNLAPNFDGNALSEFRGITATSYTQYGVNANGPGTTSLSVVKSGSGVTNGLVVASDVPTGGTVTLTGQYTYPA